MALHIKEVATKPFDDQKPGTSGLRKKVRVFQHEGYTENFVQSILSSLGSSLSGCSLIVGGDGRYFCKPAVNLILQMCAANEVSKVYVGQHGILSTPAVSALIRQYKTVGGIILTASHNPGGPDEDFGIKFNVSNGGPAPDEITRKIYECSLNITKYKVVPDINTNIDAIGLTTYEVAGKTFTVEVIDSVQNYVDLMKDIFNFAELAKMIRGGDNIQQMKILINCMSGVTGPYAKRIFIEELGAPETCVVNAVPLEDFGGRHPDPNLTYAADLVEDMKVGDFDLGAAFDGDGDRNMILGRGGFFLNPSDSLAVLADQLHVIPYFQRTGVKGFARSMPTGSAVDRVALKNTQCVYEVPTGWKYFGNLMDAGKLSLCGEESFGTGSDHIREKDGIWAALAWLSIMCSQKMTVEQLVHRHWSVYGRNFFTRYDYENCDAQSCQVMMKRLESMITDPEYPGLILREGDKQYVVHLGDNFQYEDPIDHSVATEQGIRILFKDGSRIVFRLSGTGSSGATVRLYVEAYEEDPATFTQDAQMVLGPLIQIALRLSRLEKHTGRTHPTVIT